QIDWYDEDRLGRWLVFQPGPADYDQQNRKPVQNHRGDEAVCQMPQAAIASGNNRYRIRSISVRRCEHCCGPPKEQPPDPQPLRLRRLAGGTHALQLDGDAVDRKAGGPCALLDDVEDAAIVELGHVGAFPADQELAEMRMLRPRAADEGAERFDAVNETVIEQELESAVGRRRRRGPAVATQRIEDVVGADGGVAVPDQLEDAPAQRREPAAALRAHRGGPHKSIVDAVLVIMRRGSALVLGHGLLPQRETTCRAWPPSAAARCC